MERFTISLDDQLASEFDALIAARGYENRSEAVRDLLRSELDRTRLAQTPKGNCIACLSYVFNHHELDLAERITSLQHDHHDLTVATMHAHLDHEHCLETVILKGETRTVQRFADALCAERGVRHGHVNVVSLVEVAGLAVKGKGKTGTVKRAARAHSHGIGGKPHTHFKPAN